MSWMFGSGSPVHGGEKKWPSHDPSCSHNAKKRVFFYFLLSLRIPKVTDSLRSPELEKRSRQQCCSLGDAKLKVSSI